MKLFLLLAVVALVAVGPRALLIPALVDLGVGIPYVCARERGFEIGGEKWRKGESG